MATLGQITKAVKQFDNHLSKYFSYNSDIQNARTVGLKERFEELQFNCVQRAENLLYKYSLEDARMIFDKSSKSIDLCCDFEEWVDLDMFN